MAGGTEITIHGDNFSTGARVTLGSNLTCQLLTTEQTRIVVVTPPSTTVATELQVAVTFPGYDTIPTKLTFDYQDNPTLNSVHPLKYNVM